MDKTVFTETKDITLSVIKEMVKEGDLILNPDYQRKYIYSNPKASSLIESLFMGVPIPNIYLSEEDDGTLSVIDGQQRLTSFVRYLDNNFKLSGLKVYTNLNKLKFNELPKEFQRTLKTSTLRCICLKKESKDLKYEIFSRLNQGSVKLKTQEIRNCIYRGSLNDALKRWSEKKIFGKSLIMKCNRMQYEEIILRYLTAINDGFIAPNLKESLNNFMLKNQNIDKQYLDFYEELMINDFSVINEVLGNTAFSSFSYKKKDFSNLFNGAVFDSIIASFAIFDDDFLLKNKNIIKNSINALKINNLEYIDVTASGTGGINSIISRIFLVYKTIAESTNSLGKLETNNIFYSSFKEYFVRTEKRCDICKLVLTNPDEIAITLKNKKIVVCHKDHLK